MVEIPYTWTGPPIYSSVGSPNRIPAKISIKKGKSSSKGQKKINGSTRKSGKSRSPQQGIGLSECATKYALAIADPWSMEAMGCCVPRHPSRPSQKVRGILRLTVTIGSSGVGYVLYSPCLANDKNCVAYSLGTYAGTTVGAPVDSTTVGHAFAAMSNLPYNYTKFNPSSSVFSAEIEGRIVAVGLSFQYSGTVSNMGGLSYSLCSPEHENLNGEGVKIGSSPETRVARVDNSRQWVGISGMYDDEFNYCNHLDDAGVYKTASRSVYPYSTSEGFSAVDGNNLGGSPVAVWFTGTAGNTFEVEIIQHLEYVGNSANHALTVSHGDSVGFEVVATAAAMLPTLQQQHHKASRLSLMGKALQMVLKSLAPVSRGALRGAIGGYLSGMPGGLISGAALGAASGALRL